MVIPFEEYDFENDEKYAAYLNSVELAGAPQDQAALLKRLQAKWYKNNVDPDFVPAPPQEATDKPPQPAHWSQTESPPTDTDTTAPKRPAPPEPAAAPAPRAPPASQTAVPTSLIPGMNALVQAAMLLLAFVFLASYVVQNRSLHLTTYRIFLQAALTSHVLRLVATVGYPKLWPFNWPELQQWIARVSGTSDAHYASVCLMFASQREPSLAVIASPAMFAALRLAAYVRKSFPGALSFLMPLCDRISSQREHAFYGMAVMDLSLLGVVIGRAFTQKAVLLPFVYINMLRHRYKSPVSAKYHQAIWSILVGHVQPVLKYMPGPVHTGIGYLVRWFTGRTA